uniref:Rho-GAP domain-containing protein n=1 Tax=Heterorhabditis bacteriophora TaxID=37862 RepID=A0A1I7XV32_HETBA
MELNNAYQHINVKTIRDTLDVTSVRLVDLVLFKSDTEPHPLAQPTFAQRSLNVTSIIKNICSHLFLFSLTHEVLQYDYRMWATLLLVLFPISQSFLMMGGSCICPQTPSCTQPYVCPGYRSNVVSHGVETVTATAPPDELDLCLLQLTTFLINLIYPRQVESFFHFLMAHIVKRKSKAPYFINR